MFLQLDQTMVMTGWLFTDSEWVGLLSEDRSTVPETYFSRAKSETELVLCLLVLIANTITEHDNNYNIITIIVIGSD